jgi:UDP-glucose 4-epimerase
MSIDGKKVLVAGGAGFIGSHVVEELVKRKAVVTVLDNQSSCDIRNLINISSKIKFISGNITDYAAVSSAAKDQEIIIHEAFPASLCDLSPDNQFIDTGTDGTYNLLRAASENESIFLYASSISVYGEQRTNPISEEHPLDPIITYGATKLAGEVYCKAFQKEYGLNYVILRYSDVYGPRFKRTGAPIAFLLRALGKRSLQIHGDGSQTRDYTFVTDIAKGTILGIEESAYGKIFNIASGNPCSILDLAGKVNAITGNNKGIEFLSEDNINSGKYVLRDKRQYSIDITKARKILGFEPEISLDKGLEISKKWIAEEYKGGSN